MTGRHVSALIAVVLVAAYVGAPRTVPTLDARPGCAIVEHGPTGPEPDVTLGRTVERCADGTYVVTTWMLATGIVVDVDHDPHQLTTAEAAEAAARLATIRDERRGERFTP
jgi:hypothetical protein